MIRCDSGLVGDALLVLYSGYRLLAGFNDREYGIQNGRFFFPRPGAARCYNVFGLEQPGIATI